MKKKMLSVVLATSLCLQPLAASASTESNKNKEEFIRGVDISTLDMLEDLGAKYYSNGVEDDALEILNNNGANFVRLKLWVNPYDEEGNPYGGGNNDFDTTLSLAKRADALNMGILIDFHLSDFWADPANQIKPKAWKDLSFAELKTTVHDYMKDTLNAFAEEGIVPEMIQVGNEISSGILHNDGKVENDESQFANLGSLLESAILGVRESAAADTKIILHLDQGGKNELYTWWFGNLMKYVPDLDFDVIGLSYYPMWHGTMKGLQYNMNYLSATYDKEVCIVETAYAWTTQDADEDGNVFIEGDQNIAGYPATPEGQKAFITDLEDIILNVPNDKGIGFFYWEPEWVPVKGGTYANQAGVDYKHDTVEPTNTWDNMALFDFEGNALDSMTVLNQPTENLIDNESFEIDGYSNKPSGWNVWTGDTDNLSVVKTEYGNAFDGEYKLTFWDKEPYDCSVYKTFTGIPNGTYRFSIWVMTNGNQNKLQLYAKNYGGEEVNTTITTSDINWNIYTIDEIEVTNNTCEIGVYTEAGANDWCNLDFAMFRLID